jgi:hypothetical protein
VDWENLGASRGQQWVPHKHTWDWTNGCYVPIIWEKLGRYGQNGNFVWFVKWAWKDGQKREIWTEEAGMKGGKDKGGGKNHSPQKGGTKEGGKGKDARNPSGAKGKEGKMDTKGGAKKGKEEEGEEQEWGQSAAEGAGGGEMKGKGGADGGGGEGTAEKLKRMKLAKFPDNGDSQQIRGDDLAWEHFTVPKAFTPEMEYIAGLPREDLQRWFGATTWSELLAICVKARGDPANGRWTIRCPVLACGKVWHAEDYEEALRRIGALWDHLGQKGMKEYANGYAGGVIVYPAPWWWFQINAIMKSEELREAREAQARGG